VSLAAPVGQARDAAGPLRHDPDVRFGGGICGETSDSTVVAALPAALVRWLEGLPAAGPRDISPPRARTLPAPAILVESLLERAPGGARLNPGWASIHGSVVQPVGHPPRRSGKSRQAAAASDAGAAAVEASHYLLSCAEADALYLLASHVADDGNRNACAACGGGGSIVPCDSCVCSWHELCDPRLRERGVPAGHYHCPLCRYRSQLSTWTRRAAAARQAASAAVSPCVVGSAPRAEAGNLAREAALSAMDTPRRSWTPDAAADAGPSDEE